MSMAQIYTNDLTFTKVYPMELRSSTGDTLQSFIHDVSIPHSLHSDNAPELLHGKFKRLCKDYGINNTYTEPYSPWQNRAEGGIRELKQHVQRKMTSKHVPPRLWDFCCKWSCEVRNKTASNLYALEGHTSYEATLGRTPDISSLTAFDFYDVMWYYDEVRQFPEPKRKLGRWPGEAHNFGQAMCYWILPASGKTIVCSTVQPITQDQLTKELKNDIKKLDMSIAENIGDVNDIKYDLDDLPQEVLQDIITPEYKPVAPENSMPEADDWDAEAYDQYISAEVRLPKDGQEMLGQVIARKRDADGNPVGNTKWFFRLGM
jgi:hypothetical protein